MTQISLNCGEGGVVGRVDVIDGGVDADTDGVWGAV